MRYACVLVLLLTTACGTAPSPASTEPARPAPTPAPTASSPANPNQEVNDRFVDEYRKRIAGREKEPAEQVFTNIQSMKGVPAGRLLAIMNVGYAPALGVACTHCHVAADFASDDQRPKRAAREMIAMNRMINEHLKNLKHLEGKPEERFVNCTTCHRGRIDPTAR